MPEYRALRERHSLLEICRQPELAVAVTLQPVDAIEVDAAILFSDLLLPFTPMGLDFDFVKGEGPSIERPIRHAADVDRAARVRAARGAGARARDDPDPAARAGRSGAAHRLRRRAVHARRVCDRRRAVDQLRHGQGVHVRAARGVAPALRSLRDGRSPTTCARRSTRARRRSRFSIRGSASSRATTTGPIALPHTRKIFAALAGTGVPTIHFGVNTGAILPDMKEAGGDVIGVDWRAPLDEAWDRIGHDRAIQGNLDPVRLLGPEAGLLEAADDILRRAGGRAGHIFNLGHGILPNTSLAQVQALARHVHGFGLLGFGALGEPDVIVLWRRHHRPDGRVRAAARSAAGRSCSSARREPAASSSPKTATDSSSKPGPTRS